MIQLCNFSFSTFWVQNPNKCKRTIEQFFAWSGFPCPTLQNPSDHFLKTINKDFEEEQVMQFL